MWACEKPASIPDPRAWPKGQGGAHAANLYVGHTRWEDVQRYTRSQGGVMSDLRAEGSSCPSPIGLV